MIGDKHFGVMRMEKAPWDAGFSSAPLVPAEFKEEYTDRMRVNLLTHEGNAFGQCLMQMIAKDIKALGPDFDITKYEIEMTATLQPKGTNKDIKLDA